MMYYYGNWMGHSFFGEIAMLLFWVAVIFGLVWLVRTGMGGHGHKGCSHCKSGSSALDILKERYARGEINKEEFDAKKKDLSE